ncbi:MAG: CPXCG motif-containing cysteine-rich protein [Gammaproteobacteria bacterium]|nr:CPXCG motif-containing cysteine-rich protein [Gammaproteobacteria bacterium]
MSGVEVVNIDCPYCGETIDLFIDCSVEEQRYVEDCSVCCRPIDVSVILEDDGMPGVTVSQENDA